jgi:hypothetical protein
MRKAYEGFDEVLGGSGLPLPIRHQPEKVSSDAIISFRDVIEARAMAIDKGETPMSLIIYPGPGRI